MVNACPPIRGHFKFCSIEVSGRRQNRDSKLIWRCTTQGAQRLCGSTAQIRRRKRGRQYSNVDYVSDYGLLSGARPNSCCCTTYLLALQSGPYFLTRSLYARPPDTDVHVAGQRTAMLGGWTRIF